MDGDATTALLPLEQAIAEALRWLSALNFRAVSALNIVSRSAVHNLRNGALILEKAVTRPFSAGTGSPRPGAPAQSPPPGQRSCAPASARGGRPAPRGAAGAWPPARSC